MLSAETVSVLNTLKSSIGIWKKNTWIDEEIKTRTKDYSTEYDECCKKWKQDWSKWDEALDVAISEIDCLLTAKPK